jgi:hypothetical protein
MMSYDRYGGERVPVGTGRVIISGCVMKAFPVSRELYFLVIVSCIFLLWPSFCLSTSNFDS